MFQNSGRNADRSENSVRSFSGRKHGRLSPQTPSLYASQASSRSPVICCDSRPVQKVEDRTGYEPTTERRDLGMANRIRRFFTDVTGIVGAEHDKILHRSKETNSLAKTVVIVGVMAFLATAFAVSAVVGNIIGLFIDGSKGSKQDKTGAEGEAKERGPTS